MDSISTNVLITELENEMPVFFETNKVDRSILLPTIRECVARLGTKFYEVKDFTAEIKGYKVTLPKDFYRIQEVYICVGKEVVRPDDRRGIMEVEQYYDEVDVCDHFTLLTDDCGKPTRLVQHLPMTSFSWNELYIPAIERDVPCDFKERPNCDISISVKNGELISNKNVGTVFIKYLVDPASKGQFEIPDEPFLRKWIKAEMRVKVFQFLYDNMEPDVAERLMASKQSAGIAELQARSLYKHNEPDVFYSIRNHLARRYNARSKPLRNIRPLR